MRGVLGFDCNGGRGQFRDNPAFLAAAIALLTRRQHEPPPGQQRLH